MNTATEQKVEVELPADLAKRFVDAKTPAERATVLAEFARSRGAVNPTERAATIFTEDQFKNLLDHMGTVSKTEARAAIAAIASETEERFGFKHGDAKEMAERSYESMEQKHLNQRADWESAAKMFRGIWLAKCGKPDEYKRALEEENAAYKKRFGRETRAMSLGTDSTGGYLAPQLFSDMLYDQIARTSVVRQHATIIPMNGNEIINIPVKTATVSAAQTAEATGATTSQPVFTQKQLTTKKIVAMVRPMSIEMLEKANPALIPIIVQDAMDQIMIAEDSLVFGTSGNGIRANTTNDIEKGSAATGYESLGFDELIDLETELDPQYLADKHVLGSGMLGGAPRFYLPHHLRQELKKKKSGTGEYLDESRELRNEGKIFGYEAVTTLSMPSGVGLAAGNKVAIFGNLARVFCGLEGGFRVLVNETGSVDNGGSDVDLYQTAQVSIRVLSFFDNVVIDEEGFSKIKLAA
jgi:HK97 family phage major capsid protein